MSSVPSSLPELAAPADCRRCGVCCFSAAPDYVRVTGADWARLGPDADRWAHFLGHRAFMRMREGHCAGLDMRRDEAGAPEFFCTLYERRPQVCRDLDRGSPQCAGERAAKSGRVAALNGAPATPTMNTAR